MRIWLEANCWNCKTPNMVDNGNCSDLTVDDTSGFNCYSCGSYNAFDDEGEVVESDEEQMDEGKPVPK